VFVSEILFTGDGSRFCRSSSVESRDRLAAHQSFRYQTEPLRRLMVAVLVDAIRCVQTKFAARRPSIREEFAEARSWIFSNEDSSVFSFQTVCDALEMDANAIRKCLVQWEEKRLAGEKLRMVIRHSSMSLARRISR
jgi:hypothetical protein